MKIAIAGAFVIDAWGTSPATVRRSVEVVRRNRQQLLEAWERLHGKG